ncbi:methyltransferase [Raphidocelis subcapitata]|uniref:Methyltransferase n=1 Tax=Raphidocelis subcapitata TaxID=307507 RepID=A0A2V0NZL3_9CHLO|nr:methyltransferase [Raphidocelis subcapitata]|eukprot:GBF91023.1 methyltransferase [Raphidocelis subcapitata]
MGSPEQAPSSTATAPVIPAHQNYGDADYWDERYRREPVCFDWYQGYAGLEPIISRHLSPDAPVLHVGAGTSVLQEAMVKEGGFARIVNLDVSKVAVDQMAARHRGLPQLEYKLGDVRALTDADGAFGGVLDKGALDAILCGPNAAANSAAALRECCRVLRPGGCFVLVTYGDAESRLPHLARPDLPWTVQVYVLSKPSADGREAGPYGARAALQGPFDAARGEAMEALGQLKGVHFVYVCTRQGAETPAKTEPEGRAQPAAAAARSGATQEQNGSSSGGGGKSGGGSGGGERVAA